MQNYISIGMLLSFCILMFMMYTILYETKQQSKQNKEQPQEKQPKKSKSDQADEILNALVWMLERNIITQQEYNTLIVKVSGCL